MNNRIKDALELRNMKACELCKITGIKKSSMSSWINQRWQPKADSVYIMAKCLDVVPHWLAGY